MSALPHVSTYVPVQVIYHFGSKPLHRGVSSCTSEYRGADNVYLPLSVVAE